MLHRATWKFSSLRVHTRTYVEGARVRGSVPAGVWGALRLDRSVNGTARPARARARVCVGGGAHRGTCWWPSENAFDVYHPPGTRPADYISRDRADFTNTGRVEIRTRAQRRAALAIHTRGGSRGGGCAEPPFPPSPRPLPRSTTFGQFLFIVSPLRSFNSRFSWWSSLVIAVESSVNQGTACKRLDRGERYCDGIWIDFAKRFTGTTLVERGWYRFRLDIDRGFNILKNYCTARMRVIRVNLMRSLKRVFSKM